MVKRALLLAGLVALGACKSDDTTTEPPTEEVSTPLTPEALLVRASLDLRGVRPSAAEMAAITADPSELDGMIASFVDDPRFGERVAAMFAPALRTRRDEYQYGYDLGLTEDQIPRLMRAFSEETLNLLHHVAVTDQPFTTIFTADYTVVDPILLQVWPLEEAEALEGLPADTVVARYTDSRPVAGVLATNSFYWRHTSTVENANRGRSNAISRAFLCEDFLERPIEFPKDVDLTDSESIRDAIRENDGCTACHATLDPFASHLWGFMQTVEDAQSWSYYHPENETMWVQETDADPAFFGQPTSGTLASLAVSIASDERFVGCTVRRIYEGMLGRPAVLADEGQLAFHREAFLASGLSLKALVRSLLTDPAYRGDRVTSSFGGEPEPVDLKLLGPDLLASSLADLSGYDLTVYGRRATEVDYALRALAGGSERGASTAPSLGRALVHRRLAEASARRLTEGSVDSPLGAIMSNVDVNAAPSAEVVTQLLTAVDGRFGGEEHVAQLIALWNQVSADEDPYEAWTALLTAVLSDPHLAAY